MKTLLSTCFLFLFSVTFLAAQWVQKGSNVLVKTGTKMYFGGDMRIEGGSFKGSDTLDCQNMVILANGSISGSGAGFWKMRGSLDNTGSITSDGNFYFYGNNLASINGGASTLRLVTLAKTGAATVANLSGPLTVSIRLAFNGANNKLQLNNFPLTLTSTAVFTGNLSTNYVVTNGSGSLRKQGLANTLFQFPVGANTTTYNPIDLTNAGITDDYGVRCLADALSAGGNGSVLSTHDVMASWEVTETVAGGSLLTLSAKWLPGDEGAGFTRSSCSVRRWNGSAWDASPLGSGHWRRFGCESVCAGANGLE